MKTKKIILMLIVMILGGVSFVNTWGFKFGFGTYSRHGMDIKIDDNGNIKNKEELKREYGITASDDKTFKDKIIKKRKEIIKEKLDDIKIDIPKASLDKLGVDNIGTSNGTDVVVRSEEFGKLITEIKYDPNKVVNFTDYRNLFSGQIEDYKNIFDCSDTSITVNDKICDSLDDLKTKIPEIKTLNHIYAMINVLDIVRGLSLEYKDYKASGLVKNGIKPIENKKCGIKTSDGYYVVDANEVKDGCNNSCVPDKSRCILKIGNKFYSPKSSEVKRTYYSAYRYCKDMKIGGYKWRLPTQKEYINIIYPNILSIYDIYKGRGHKESYRTSTTPSNKSSVYNYNGNWYSFRNNRVKISYNMLDNSGWPNRLDRNNFVRCIAETTQPTDGVCNNNVKNSCKVGLYGNDGKQVGDYWRWSCKGTNGGKTVNCSKKIYTIKITYGRCSNELYKCKSGEVVKLFNTLGYYKWKCKGSIDSYNYNEYCSKKILTNTCNYSNYRKWNENNPQLKCRKKIVIRGGVFDGKVIWDDTDDDWGLIVSKINGNNKTNYNLSRYFNYSSNIVKLRSWQYKYVLKNGRWWFESKIKVNPPKYDTYYEFRK